MVPISEIIAHNEQFLRQKGRLRLFAAPAATIVFASGNGISQLCQIGFAKDGSFRVEWPYLAIQEGMIADVSFVGQAPAKITMNLTEKGRFTSQLVKFSHHTSGLALFSLTGRARSEVRRQSINLCGPIGRLFHLTAATPMAFKPLTRLKPRRAYLVFAVPKIDVSCLEVSGEWRRKADVVANAEGKGNVGPVGRIRDRRTGENRTCIFYGAPIESPVAKHIVMISGVPVAPPDGVTEPSVIFIGGHDPHEVREGQARNEASSKGALAALYPTHGSEDMKRRVGSIDLNLDLDEPEASLP
jgi:hypothetical protein